MFNLKDNVQMASFFISQQNNANILKKKLCMYITKAKQVNEDIKIQIQCVLHQLDQVSRFCRLTSH